MADEPTQVQIMDEELQQRKTLFREFLDSEDIQGASEKGSYRSRIHTLLATGSRRLIVNIDALRQYNRAFTDELLNSPTEFMPALDEAFKDAIAAETGITRNDLDQTPFYVGLRGSFGDNHVNPRSLRSMYLGKMVCIEGIVTRCSLVHPKVIRSVHYSEQEKKHYAREYSDALSSTNPIPSGSVYPTESENGNPLVTEFGHCIYRDHQTITIQEMPERAPPGQLPRSVDVVLDDDLVDKAKPGDRVSIVGIYRSLGNRNANQTTSTFKTVIVCNDISLLSTKAGGGIASPVITDADVRNINKLAKDKRRPVFETLSQSLAPSIWGHDYIKRAVLLLLLGGVEKNLENGTHIRGDINMMMVGDPSTAKSQILRYILGIAPLAIATTGRGSSGVGLTAAVTSDKETGDRRLEAGAMVLADRGVVCIDEFDKMSDVDRVAIHEVMEQQTVTIAKAGIHTSLNARCSVVAAANPLYGQYDPSKDPAKNIALPDSLLSRFDLLFVVTDTMEEARDRQISEHVLSMHRYVPPGLEEGAVIVETVDDALAGGEPEVADDDQEIYEKYNQLLHSGVRTRSSNAPKILKSSFVKKYIYYAKSQIEPVLSKDATDTIISEYTSLRNDQDDPDKKKTAPVTARTLETLIRLSTAHAKARLSNKVQKKDAKSAAEILRFAMFKEVVRKTRTKRRRVAEDGSDMETESGEEDMDSEDEEGEEEDEENEILEEPSRDGDVEMEDVEMTGTLPGARQNLFAEKMVTVLQSAETITFDDALAGVNAQLGPSQKFSRDECRAALQTMAERNQIMYTDGMIYVI
ncbi:MCM2/3/5 family-domain-containing protein [Syncephalastrum racemosum]|uniref:DNA replication licensing factor MCM3 n=1 Tax=Syncephalastrum racemosum TaxID=13706 RepID=A0A1X2H133_SYNRA|nr:MCM2/3/5 family-domain-containing protein [Syncephalastrum racemosum]